MKYRGVMREDFRSLQKSLSADLNKSNAFRAAHYLLIQRSGAAESLPREPLQRLSPSWPG
jgi:hypothetical protein